jgi:hypothetical protein
MTVWWIARAADERLPIRGGRCGIPESTGVMRGYSLCRDFYAEGDNLVR